MEKYLATLPRIWQPCISVKIGGDQDFSDFILFDNIRCLDDIKHISDDFPSRRGARAAVWGGGKGRGYIGLLDQTAHESAEFYDQKAFFGYDESDLYW